MPEIISEYVDEWTCCHYFEIACCDPTHVTGLAYTIDWHETESQSPDDLLKRYRCPYCKARLTEKQIFKKLQTPRQIAVRVYSEHYNKNLHQTKTAGVKEEGIL